MELVGVCIPIGWNVNKMRNEIFQDDESTVVNRKRKRLMTEDDFFNGSGRNMKNTRNCMNGDDCFKEKCTFSFDISLPICKSRFPGFMNCDIVKDFQ